MDTEMIEGQDDGLTLAGLVVITRPQSDRTLCATLQSHLPFARGDGFGTFMRNAFGIQIGSHDRTSGTSARRPQNSTELMHTCGWYCTV